jgi:hypothetical protein
MTNTDLLIRLRELHEELSTMNDDVSSSEPVDEETIDALGQLITDVNVLVDQARENNTIDDETHQTDVLDRISRFETQHPRVTSFLSQVTDILAMMGI